MKIKLWTGILVLFAGHALASEPVVKEVHQQTIEVECGTLSFLETLAQTIQKTNKLSLDINFFFDDVRTINKDYRDGQLISLKCMSNLKLIDHDDQTSLDSLVLTYGLKQDAKGSYVLSFEPQR